MYSITDKKEIVHNCKAKIDYCLKNNLLDDAENHQEDLEYYEICLNDNEVYLINNQNSLDILEKKEGGEKYKKEFTTALLCKFINSKYYPAIKG